MPLGVGLVPTEIRLDVRAPFPAGLANEAGLEIGQSGNRTWSSQRSL